MKITKDLLEMFTNKKIDEKIIVNILSLVGFESDFYNNTFDISIPTNRKNCANVFSILEEINKFDSSYLLSMSKIKCSNTIDFHMSNLKSSIAKTYCIASIKKINNNILTPESVADSLEKNGIKCKNFAVDLANFSIILFGQPMHVYDFNKIGKTIELLKLPQDKSFKSINGRKYLLKKGMEVVKSGDQIISIPGIIGSYGSKVDNDTKAVIIESAFFYPDKVKEYSDIMSINTLSANLFQRVIYKDRIIPALNYIKYLFSSTTKCKTSRNLVIENKNKSILKNIKLNLKTIHKILGININSNVINNNLIKLGFKSNYDKEKKFWVISVDSTRQDLNIEEDIINELIKIYTLNNLPPKALEITTQNYNRRSNYYDNTLSFLKSFLINKSFYETINYTFVNYEFEKIISNSSNLVLINNPVSNNFNTIRSSLLQGLIKSAVYNLNMGLDEVGLFEFSKVFNKNKCNIISNYNLGCILAKRIFKGCYNYQKNFTDYKNILDTLIIEIIGCSTTTYKQIKLDYLYSECSLKIILDNQCVGYIGILKKDLLTHLNKKKYLFYFFELNLNKFNLKKKK